MLWRALGVCPGDVVALTGGGGKTSLAFRLAQELQAAGRPAILTTTTRMFPAPGMRLVLTDQPGWDAAVSAELAAGRSVCVGAREEDWSGKLVGLEEEAVAHLRRFGAGAVLVEADGSKGLPLKAPALHEPVIPGCADLVVPVAGATSLGRPLSAEVAHRVEEVARAAGVAPGALITPEVAAAATFACTRGTPAGARVVPVLGQADAADLAALADVAARLTGRTGRIVAAAPRAQAPVQKVWGDVAAVVLAGGASRRFGSGKLLHPLAGKSVLEASLSAPLRAGLREVLVVTGAYAPELGSLLHPYPVRTVPNPAWQEGMAASLRSGIRALEPDPPGAVLLCLGDQPWLDPVVVTHLVEAWRRTGAPIVAPVCGGARRNPVLFDWRLAPELLTITGDEGGRSLVRKYQDQMLTVPFEHPRWFSDIDTPADLTQ